MTTIRVREKRQITLPAKASEALGISENDLLEVEVTAQSIILRPIRGDESAKMSRLLRYVGIGANLSSDPDSSVRDMRKDRNEWK